MPQKKDKAKKEGITESARKLFVVPIKRNIKRGYLDIFKHPLGSKDPRVKKEVNMAEKKSTSPGPHGASITIQERRTSPGPHGASRKTEQFHKLQKFEKFKFKGVTKEMAEERKGEPARKAGGMSARPLTRKTGGHEWSEPMTKEQKAKELTRKMEKGYRKGYRVPKRPKSGNGRKAKRDSRKSGRSSGR